MLLVKLGAGLGNYLFTFFIYKNVAEHYNQEMVLLEEYSPNKSLYTNIIDGLNVPNYKKILFEYSDEGTILAITDHKVDEIIKKYYDKCAVSITQNDLIFGYDQKISVQDETIFDRYNTIICSCDSFYDENIRAWLLNNRGTTQRAFSLISDKFVDLTKQYEIGIHIRIYKMLSLFDWHTVKTILNHVINMIRKYYHIIMVFTDSIYTTKLMIREHEDVLRFVDIPISSPQKDLKELVMMSKCRLLVKFDFSSFNFWAEMLADDQNKSFIFQIKNERRLVNALMYRITKFEKVSGIHIYQYAANCKSKYRRAEFYKKWLKRQCNVEYWRFQEWIDENHMQETVVNRYFEQDKVINEEYEDNYETCAKQYYAEEKYEGCAEALSDVIYRIKNRDLHLLYYRALLQSGHEYDAYLEKIYLRYLWGYEDKEQFHNQKLNDSYHRINMDYDYRVYAYIDVRRNSFSCITSYIEDIGIMFSKMGFDVTFIVHENQKENFFFASNDLMEFMKQSWERYPVKFVSEAEFEFDQEADKANRKRLFWVKKGYVNLDILRKLKNCNVFFCNQLKWYDELSNNLITEEVIKEVKQKNRVTLLTASENVNKDIYDNIVYFNAPPVFRESEDRLTVYELKRCDEYLLDIVNQCLMLITSKSNY